MIRFGPRIRRNRWGRRYDDKKAQDGPGRPRRRLRVVGGDRREDPALGRMGRLDENLRSDEGTSPIIDGSMLDPKAFKAVLAEMKRAAAGERVPNPVRRKR